MALSPTVWPWVHGQPKPERTRPATKLIVTALKLACHAGISWENINDNAFTTAVRTELLKAIADLENHEIVYDNPTSGELNGMTTTTGILTFAATGSTRADANNFDDIAGAIATLTTGPALCEPDLLLLHPDTWASIRTQKAAGTGAYFVALDPGSDQGNRSGAWTCCSPPSSPPARACCSTPRGSAGLR